MGRPDCKSLSPQDWANIIEAIGFHRPTWDDIDDRFLHVPSWMDHDRYPRRSAL